MPPAPITTLLLDIEGTVAPISFVHDVLFPHARRHMEAYLHAHWNHPQVASARALLDQPGQAFSEQSLASLLAEIFRLMDGDVKSTGLKQLQGLIWDEGYRSGAFQSPVYPDVPLAMKRWKTSGKTIAIYSSGSIAAQKVFFRFTTAGDLTPFLSHYFDTTTGPKRSPASYAAIARAMTTSPDQILFLSDVLEEVEAAAIAGCETTIVKRPGNASILATDHRSIATFDELH